MPKKILIVDDQLINRQILVRMLSGNYDISEAPNGEEAMVILGRESRDISAVLLDIVMPGMSGFDVLSGIRSDATMPQIPVIMLTGSDDEEARVKALSLGANDYVIKPYNPDIIRHCLSNNITLYEMKTTVAALQRDRLTGLYGRDAFFDRVKKMVAEHEPGYYMMACFDIEKFKIINDQYGTAKGDEVLKYIAGVFIEGFENGGGVCCRIAGDDFAVLYPRTFSKTDELDIIHKRACTIEGLAFPLVFRVGRYVVDDPLMTPSAMYDRAMLAADSIRGRYDRHIAVYTESLRDQLIRSQEVVIEMERALASRQFEVWYQPQYNHTTGALIGAEALVRWCHPKKGLIPPAEFISIFEQNGFIYSLDKFVWEEVCRFLRKRADGGDSPLPVSVNVSRYDILRPDIVYTITGLIAKYNIPAELLRLEITESAFAESTKEIVATVKKLISYGFTVEIDDFGSGYSSLNTLRNVPAQIVKLDIRFFEDDGDSRRGGNIIESVVRMAKWLGMSVIAEGVEHKTQADYLKSIGCNYIQGYLYSKPVTAPHYETLYGSSDKEKELYAMELIKNLDNNAFWDPKSMETLIFNSYVGGACIFEYYNGNAEIIRYNEEFSQIFSGNFVYDFTSADSDILKHLSTDELNRLTGSIRTAISEDRASACEFCIENGGGELRYLRATMRVIARSDDRYLFYCVVVNITEQRTAEKKEYESAQRLQAIMDNIDGGITAVVIEDDKPKLLFANDRFYGMLGYTKEQFEAELSGPFEAIYPEDRERVKGEAVMASECQKPVTSTYRVTRRDGGVRWMMSTVSITRLPGVVSPVQLAMATDITSEKENALKMDELLNAIPGGVAIYRVGKTLKTLYSSDGVAMLTGVSDSEYRKWKNGDLLSSAIFEDDLPRVREAIYEAVSAGAPVNITFRLRHKNNSLVWVALSASMIREETEGRIYYAIFTKPATEAALYQSLIEDSPTASVILEKYNRKVLYANPAWRAIEGVSETAVVTGKPLFELIRKEMRYFSDSELAALPTGYYLKADKTSNAGKKISLQAKALTWNGVDAYVCYLTDETERQNIRQQLEQLIDMVPVGIGICDIINGKLSLRYINDAYYKLLGFERRERASYFGFNVINAIYPGDRKTVSESLLKVVNGSDVMDVPYRTYNSKNELLWMRIQASVIKREDDTVTVYCALTDFMSAMADIRHAEKVIRSILSSDNGTVIEINSSTGRINSLITSSSGISPDDLISAANRSGGLTSFIKSHCVERDIGRVVVEASLEFVKKKLAEAPVYTMSYSALRDGREVPRYAVYTYMEDNKQTVLCVIRDII